MITLYPTIALTALNSGTYASVMIPMMVDSMEDLDDYDWSK